MTKLKLRYKLLAENVLFTLLFYLTLKAFAIYFNNSPSTDFYEAIDQVISFYFYSLSYLLILPVWIIAFLFGKWKRNKEIEYGSALSFSFSSLIILLFYFLYYR